jgi:transcriptional regulator with XRE-family HTH domain
MEQNSFGNYLRELRNSKTPSMSQEELATAIGRKKMTISQFEKEKNFPPQGELLDKIIVALNLSLEEEHKLRYLASKERKTVPEDIQQYFFEHPSIYKFIRAAQLRDCDDEFWINLLRQIYK